MGALHIARSLERCTEYNPRYFTPTEEQRRQFDELRGVAALIRLAYAESVGPGRGRQGEAAMSKPFEFEVSSNGHPLEADGPHWSASMAVHVDGVLPDIAPKSMCAEGLTFDQQAAVYHMVTAAYCLGRAGIGN